LLAASVVLAAAPAAACSSVAPSYPHSWCAPLIAQFHAKESRQAYLSGLTALQKSGAPVAQLIADESQVVKDVAAINDASSGTAGYTAGANAPGDLAKVAADLKTLNGECGQAADAYKSDNT
jgi:hypothetical protein